MRSLVCAFSWCEQFSESTIHDRKITAFDGFLRHFNVVEVYEKMDKLLILNKKISNTFTEERANPLYAH
ncbi:MAG: hypothetical protein ACJAYG_001799 [Oceanicoccus sp.]|jgi:hypothetical protein